MISGVEWIEKQVERHIPTLGTIFMAAGVWFRFNLPLKLADMVMGIYTTMSMPIDTNPSLR